MYIFATFLTACFYSLERRFLVIDYHKTHFPAPSCLNKKGAKIANFEQKAWTNPFGNFPNFRKFAAFPLFLGKKGQEQKKRKMWF